MVKLVMNSTHLITIFGTNLRSVGEVPIVVICISMYVKRKLRSTVFLDFSKPY